MNDLELLYQSAVAQHRAGKTDRAEELCRQALASHGSFARAWELLGLISHERGETLQAIEYLERAIALEPHWPGFFHDLGNIYWSAGRHDEAERTLRQALRAMPQSIPTLATLGKVLYALGRTGESLEIFRSVLALCASAPESLAHAYSELGLADEARAAYRRASETSPDPALRVLAATQLPLVYESHEHLLACRRRLESDVEALLAAGVSQDIKAQAAKPVFSLAHQGLNDVGLQKKLARLYRPPPVPPTRPKREADQIRVGFISSYFGEYHTVARLTFGLIARLARSDMHVTVFGVGPDHHPVARALAAAVHEFVSLPRDLSQARQRILDQGVDVLVYTDIGMDQITYSLAFSRLARVQCVTWGHSDTTGIESIDYFISSELLESADADDHYSEKLVRMPGLTLYFDRSPPPAKPLDRSAFGLDPAKRLYACPQTIYKFHPDFDAALAGVLRRDPQAQIVLIRSLYPHPDEVLRQRFARTMPDVADRIVFIRRLLHAEYFNLLMLSDVVLDPFPYGGCTSSLEAFSFGVPIVTLPTQFLRGRFTPAFYRRLGVTSCIARNTAEYIDIAVRLGTDLAFRQQVREQIVAGQAQLFGDDSVVNDWQRFLQQVAWTGIDGSKQGTTEL